MILKIFLGLAAGVFAGLSTTNKLGLEKWRAKKQAEKRFDRIAGICVTGVILGFVLHLAVR